MEANLFLGLNWLFHEQPYCANDMDELLIVSAHSFFQLVQAPSQVSIHCQELP